MDPMVALIRSCLGVEGHERRGKIEGNVIGDL